MKQHHATWYFYFSAMSSKSSKIIFDLHHACKWAYTRKFLGESCFLSFVGILLYHKPTCKTFSLWFLHSYYCSCTITLYDITEIITDFRQFCLLIFCSLSQCIFCSLDKYYLHFILKKEKQTQIKHKLIIKNNSKIMLKKKKKLIIHV